MTAGHGIRIDRSRCVRHRYNKSACTRCIDACRVGAVVFSDGLKVDRKSCTGCMLCVSACPGEALAIDGYSLQRTLSDLGKAEKPVLSCSEAEGLLSHSGGPCLGFLSREHVLSIPILLGKRVQLNMTQCGSCANGHVVDRLAERLSGLDNMEPVLSAEDLDYRDLETSRRDFFQILRGGSVRAIQEFSHFSRDDETQSSYSRKTLPGRRRLLNAAYGKCADAMRSGFGDCYVSAVIGESCSGCMACVAMCPTGALSMRDKALGFDAFSCTGCMLCEEFCPTRAVVVARGVNPLQEVCAEPREVPLA